MPSRLELRRSRPALKDAARPVRRFAAAPQAGLGAADRAAALLASFAAFAAFGGSDRAAMASLARALRLERQHAKAGDPRYDLGRHLALSQAMKALRGGAAEDEKRARTGCREERSA